MKNNNAFKKFVIGATTISSIYLASFFLSNNVQKFTEQFFHSQPKIELNQEYLRPKDEFLEDILKNKKQNSYKSLELYNKILPKVSSNQILKKEEINEITSNEIEQTENNIEKIIKEASFVYNLGSQYEKYIAKILSKKREICDLDNFKLSKLIIRFGKKQIGRLKKINKLKSFKNFPSAVKDYLVKTKNLDKGIQKLIWSDSDINKYKYVIKDFNLVEQMSPEVFQLYGKNLNDILSKGFTKISKLEQLRKKGYTGIYENLDGWLNVNYTFNNKELYALVTNNVDTSDFNKYKILNKILTIKSMISAMVNKIKIEDITKVNKETKFENYKLVERTYFGNFKFKDTKKPNMLVLFSSYDQGTALINPLEKKMIDKLKTTYDISFRTIEDDYDIVNSVSAIDSINLLYVVGHGSPYGITLNYDPLFNEETKLDTSDKWINFIKSKTGKNSQVFLNSCSTGKGKGKEDNFANFVNKQLEVPVISFDDNIKSEDIKIKSLYPFKVYTKNTLTKVYVANDFITK